MPQLSVVIITFNEEKNIARCLESIKNIADDIVVVDSFSKDQTEAICNQFNVNFIQHNWEGYSATKNFANKQAKFDWILSLDADEALSEKLKQSILKIKQAKELDLYKFNRLTNYCDFWIKHCGWYPDTKIRIFDRRITQWEGVIHEELIINSNKSPLQLEGDCLHYSYYSIEEHYKQADKFSTIAANALFEKGKKINIIKFIFSPLIKFAECYVVKLGFLDGYYGFVICKISAYTTYQKFLKLRKLSQ